MRAADPLLARGETIPCTYVGKGCPRFRGTLEPRNQYTITCADSYVRIRRDSDGAVTGDVLVSAVLLPREIAARLDALAGAAEEERIAVSRIFIDPIPGPSRSPWGSYNRGCETDAHRARSARRARASR